MHVVAVRGHSRQSEAIDGPVVHVVAQVRVHACPESHVTCGEGRAGRAARRPRSLHLEGRKDERRGEHMHARRTRACPHAIRAHLRPSEAIRGHRRPSEAIRGHRRPSEAIRAHQGQSEAIRGHQSPCEAIRAHQSHLGVAEADEKVPIFRTHGAHSHALGEQQTHAFARRL